MKIPHSLLTMLLLSSCVHGPEQERKSPIDVLSGEHYQQSSNVFGVPFLERKIKNTEISGQVSIVDPLAVVPNYLKVQLWKDKQMLLEESPDKTGRFSLQGNFPNGAYVLRAASNRFTGEIPVTIDSYKIENLMLIAEKNANRVSRD